MLTSNIQLHYLMLFAGVKMLHLPIHNDVRGIQTLQPHLRITFSPKIGYLIILIKEHVYSNREHISLLVVTNTVNYYVINYDYKNNLKHLLNI